MAKFQIISEEHLTDDGRGEEQMFITFRAKYWYWPFYKTYRYYSFLDSPSRRVFVNPVNGTCFFWEELNNVLVARKKEQELIENILQSEKTK